MINWQDKIAGLITSVTAAMLLATGGTLINVSNQQAKVIVQIENITEKLNTLTDNVGRLENRVRSLEIQR